MGTTAFVFLMAGELSISLLLAGRSAAEHLQLYRQTSHMLGLQDNWHSRYFRPADLDGEFAFQGDAKKVNDGLSRSR